MKQTKKRSDSVIDITYQRKVFVEGVVFKRFLRIDQLFERDKYFLFLVRNIHLVLILNCLNV